MLRIGCKCKFNSATSDSNEKWNNDQCQCGCKNYLRPRKGYSCICEIYEKH